MATPDGYIYSKEAILENLLQQKKAIKRKLAAFEAQQQEEQQKVRCTSCGNVGLVQSALGW
jgi:nitric oxide synthase-interacting protein